MKVPTVVRGDDPQVLRALEIQDGRDPSGFEQIQYTNKDVAFLLAQLQNQLRLLCEDAPEELTEFLPDIIPVFGKGPSEPFCVALWDPRHKEAELDIRTSTESSTGFIAEAQKMPAWRPRGVAFGFSPGDLKSQKPSVKRGSRHELLHLFCPNYEEVLGEAIVERLDSCLDGGQGGQIREVAWGTPLATAGLRADDFGSLRYAPETWMMMTIGAISLLQREKKEDVWNLCKEIVFEAEEKGIPRTPKVDEIIHKVFGKHGDELLRHPALRKAAMGPQQIMYPYGKDAVICYSTDMLLNRRYKSYDPQAIDKPKWNLIQYAVEKAPAVAALKLKTAIGDVDLSHYPFQSGQALTFDVIAEDVKNATRGSVQPHQIRSITCTLGNIIHTLYPQN